MKATMVWRCRPCDGFYRKTTCVFRSFNVAIDGGCDSEMNDSDITMEEYVQRETEKALKKGKVYNWEIATYGELRYDEDVHYLKFFETEFLAIVYDDALTSDLKFSSEPTISPLIR
ncbi:hypothetical protein Tco_0541341 [Tanacetum coccineum]